MRRRSTDAVRSPAAGGRSPRGRDLLTPSIMATALVTMALVAYAQLAATRIGDEQADLVPIADGVAKRVSEGHLFLVQALGGDTTVSVSDDVFGNLAEATRLVDAAYNGGPSVDGAPIPSVENPVLREDLRLLAAQVDSFTTLSFTRWSHRERAGQIGTKADQEFDALYETILAQTERLATDVDGAARAGRNRITRINVTVLAGLLVLFAGIAVTTRRTRRAIVAHNAELERRVSERTQELARREAEMAAIVSTAGDAIVTVDETGTIRAVNPAAERIFGFAAGQLVGQPVSAILVGSDAPDASDAAGGARESIARRRGGAAFPVEISVSEAEVHDGSLFVAVIRDVTERKQVEAELHAAKAAAEEAATHDPLTGLWNHNRILELLVEEMSRADRQGQPLSLAMMDLDHFKQTNDAYGHVVGDEVLREIARRLQDAVRAYDSVGRFGGEEFMVVFPGSDAIAAEQAAERIRERVARDPVMTSAGALRVTTSLGVVTREGLQGGDATALLVAADNALYDSKAGGRDRVTVSAGALAPD